MKIDYLANNPDCVAQISKWCCEEWPWYYNNGELKSAISYHQRTAQVGAVPCALVAFEGDQLVGTISIIEEDMDLRPTLTPWLGCLYVSPPFRGRGVAAQLINEGIKVAKSLKIRKIFAWTATLTDALRSQNWDYMEQIKYQGKDVDLYCLELSDGA
jgi:GNAT superfamily N-acetyltransferase